MSLRPKVRHAARRSVGLSFILVGLVAITLFGAGLALTIPGVRLRAQIARAAVRDRFFPPAESLPTPVGAIAMPTFAAPSATAVTPTAAATPAALPMAGTARVQATDPGLEPTGEATAALVPALAEDLPPVVQLTGAAHEDQGWKNCGPATLAMSLSFWAWSGNQTDAATFLKPDPDDRNVMPYEMANYVERVGLAAVICQGGTLETLIRFVANGYPVIAEKAFWVDEDRGWMGHYVLVTGYDDDMGVFTAQDSFNGPDQQYPYGQFLADWRGFNYVFLVTFPSERLDEAMALLGPDTDERQNTLNALEHAQAETTANLTNQDRAFVWFTVGTNYNLLGQYEAAAAAFDQARVLGLPWRMLWYQTGPYQAYYSVGRYADVVTLADTTLGDALGVLEESHYWRGYARQALGDDQAAKAAWRTALEFNPNFTPAREALTLSGPTP